MKLIAFVVALLMLIGVGLLVYTARPVNEEVLVPRNGDEGGLPRETFEERHPSDLEARIGRIEDRLDLLERRFHLNPGGGPAHTSAGKATQASAPRIEEVPDARPHLEKYRESFLTDERGSEYFRLAVDAYAVQLLDDIVAIIRSDSENPRCRQRLIEMLGSKRFIGNRTAIAGLLDALSSSDPAVLKACLGSLRVIGGAEAGFAIEKRVWGMPSDAMHRTALGVLVRLLESEANHALFRLFTSASDNKGRTLVLGYVNPSESKSALDIFRIASGSDPPVRLQGAKRIGHFREPVFREFVDAWIRFETDPTVLASLKAAKKKQSLVPNYHPLKLTGPADANPAGDHPNAWAARQAEMGLQWVELRYRDPFPANEIRIHEVYVAGAVVEAIVIDTGGSRHTVWKGSDPTRTPGVFSIRFQKTSFKVAGVRIVIDTDAKIGWEEIDAVELVGPGARRWAYRATASSTYAR